MTGTRRGILCYINGKRHVIEGEMVFQPVTELLRYHCQMTGTKVVCAEGDCGACTILLGRLVHDALVYQPVNACIQYIYQLDCTHLVTIEGINLGDALNPVQEAILRGHGAQCGYCTPGIVMALCHMVSGLPESRTPTVQDVRACLTGNLCRCTGYDAIIKSMARVDTSHLTKLPQVYPSEAMRADFMQHQHEAVFIQSGGRNFYKPVTLEQATRLKQDHPQATWIAGGTDVSVFCNKRDFEPSVVISTNHLPGLNTLEIQDNHVVIGAHVTLTQLETDLAEIFPEFCHVLEVFGSPQIKNAGTLAGNIANGSPVGDSLPFLFVMDAEVELTGVECSRWVNINTLYQGYRSLNIHPDELITRTRIPLLPQDDILKLYKISKRKHLDISTFAAAIRMALNDAQITSAKIAYGGVGPVVLRLPNTEAFLIGKSPARETFEQAAQLAVSEVTPISDVRGSKAFRQQLAHNILLKFYHEAIAALEAAAIAS